MKIAVNFRDGIDEQEILSQLKTYIDFEIVDNDPEYVFSFGGDGTFLDAFSKFGLGPIYVPINFGNLGFFSACTRDNLSLIPELLDGPSYLEVNPLVVKVYKDDVLAKSFLCINDATVLNPIHTLMLDVEIQDRIVEHYRGTGICLSTAAGSTAYNKSLGGSVIDPNLELFQMTHIAPINNVVYRSIGNSVIFSKNDEIKMFPIDERFNDSLLTADRTTYKLDQVDKLCFELSNQKVQILTNKVDDFYQRLSKSFICNDWYIA